MDIKDLLEYKNFVVVGDTLNDSKYGYMIKHKLLEKHYNVSCVYKELSNIDEVEYDEFVIDMVINPVKGYELLSKMTKRPVAVIFQPDTISEEIKELLDSRDIKYIEACVLVGLSIYK